MIYDHKVSSLVVNIQQSKKEEFYLKNLPFIFTIRKWQKMLLVGAFIRKASNLALHIF